MTQMQTWPKPPIPKKLFKPEIPSEFVIFGINIKVVDNQPNIVESKTDISSKVKNKEEMSKFNMVSKSKESLFASFTIFERIIDGIVNSKDTTILVSQLKNIHVDMNTIFNIKRKEEAQQILKENISDKRKEMAKLKQKIDETMNETGFEAGM